jgi:hypothetical protein
MLPDIALKPEEEITLLRPDQQLGGTNK